MIILLAADVRFTIFHEWLGLYDYSDVNINKIVLLYTIAATKQQVSLQQWVGREVLVSRASLIAGMEYGTNNGMENGMERQTYTVAANSCNWRCSV